MTTRLKGLTVTFDYDIREDDAELIINAIKMIKGVLDVSPNAVNTDDFMNRKRIEMEIQQKIYNVFK